MRVGVIPARGGSKRIPGKNIRSFCGRPMIAWTIDALRDSGCVDRIVVSTDDGDVSAVAVACGAEVPFRRPAALADDQTPTLPVIAHAVSELTRQGWPVEQVCCAYATAPLMRGVDVAAAFDALRAGVWRYAFSCTTFPFPVLRALTRAAEGGVQPMFPEFIAHRSQDLPEAFHDAGQFYWGDAAAFLSGLPIFAPHSYPYLIDRHRVQDIDTEEDWRRAEALFLSQQLQAQDR
jgi:N-acylneuraminate cytidylyltransferase